MKIDSRSKDYIQRDWVVLNGDTGKPIRYVCMVDDETYEYVHADDPPKLDEPGEEVLYYTKIAWRIDIDPKSLVVNIWP